MDTLKLRYTRKEAAHALGISMRTLDYRIQRGEIATKRDGKKILILREVLRRYAAADHPETAKA